MGFPCDVLNQYFGKLLIAKLALLIFTGNGIQNIIPILKKRPFYFQP